MMYSFRLRLVICVALAGWAGALLTAPSGLAQTRQRSGEGVGRLIPEKDFEKDREEYKQFQAIRKGEQAVTAANKATIDHGAQWYAYRLTHVEYHHDSDATKAATKTIHDLVTEALQQIVDPKRAKPEQQAFVREFGKQLALRLKEVLKNPKYIVRVNAGIILDRLAQTGEAEVAKIYAEVLQDPKEHDAIKLWALRGLDDLFAHKRKNDTPPARLNEPLNEPDATAVAALYDYLSRKVTFPEGTPREEEAAFHFVRGAGYKALGKTRWPALFKLENKKPKIEKPTAFLLLQVMRKAGVSPEPTVAEQVEAAVGVCQLRPKILPDFYQVEYVAHQVGQFVADFADIYNQERQGGAARPSEPWKVHAARLAQAMTELQADVEKTPASPYINKLVPMALPVLNDIRDGKTAPNPANLNSWLGQNPPKSTTVYKGEEGSAIKPTEKTEK